MEYGKTHDSTHHRRHCNLHALFTVALVSEKLWGGGERRTGGPLTLSNIRTPFLPILLPQSILAQSLLLFTQILMIFNLHHVDTLFSSQDHNRRSAQSQSDQLTLNSSFLPTELLL